MKAIFFKILCFFIVFSNFSSFKVFLIFSQKKNKIGLTNKVESHFYEEIIPFDTLSTLFFFKKKLMYFSKKKPKLGTFWEILLFQLHSTANLLQFGEKNSHLKMWTNIVFSMNTIGKQRVKKRTIWVDNFALIFINMAQNNKPGVIERQLWMSDTSNDGYKSVPRKKWKLSFPKTKKMPQPVSLRYHFIV